MHSRGGSGSSVVRHSLRLLIKVRREIKDAGTPVVLFVHYLLLRRRRRRGSPWRPRRRRRRGARARRGATRRSDPRRRRRPAASGPCRQTAGCCVELRPRAATRRGGRWTGGGSRRWTPWLPSCFLCLLFPPGRTKSVDGTSAVGLSRGVLTTGWEGRRRWGRRGAPTCGARRPSGWSSDQGRPPPDKAPRRAIGPRRIAMFGPTHTTGSPPFPLVSLLSSSTATCLLYHRVDLIRLKILLLFPE